MTVDDRMELWMVLDVTEDTDVRLIMKDFVLDLAGVAERDRYLDARETRLCAIPSPP